MADPLYPCLGMHFLGMCAYDPAQPYSTYFTVGDAVAALGFTLAIQQLFKPIFLFRLRAYGLKLVYLPLAVFLGAVCTVVAMLVPNFSIAHSSPFSYPIFWEFLGGFVIASAYALVGVVSFLPARIYSFNLDAFCRAAAHLLASGNDDDRTTFAGDVLQPENIERLIQYARGWEVAELASSAVEFERLRAIKAPLQITGQVPISPFYLFAHRKELRAASNAGTLLRILSDPDFCSVLVRKTPLLTAAAINHMAERHLRTDQARPFIQEIARQAILSEDSLLAKEVGYKGFASLPVLSEALFGDPFILDVYSPLSSLRFDAASKTTSGYVSRLNKASELMMETTLRGGNYWNASYMYGVEGHTRT